MQHSHLSASGSNLTTRHCFPFSFLPAADFSEWTSATVPGWRLGGCGDCRVIVGVVNERQTTTGTYTAIFGLEVVEYVNYNLSSARLARILFSSPPLRSPLAPPMTAATPATLAETPKPADLI